MTGLQPEQPTQLPRIMCGKTDGGKKRIAVSGQISCSAMESLPAIALRGDLFHRVQIKNNTEHR
jgi:hypothetical protein